MESEELVQGLHFIVGGILGVLILELLLADLERVGREGFNCKSVQGGFVFLETKDLVDGFEEVFLNALHLTVLIAHPDTEVVDNFNDVVIGWGALFTLQNEERLA